MTQSELVDFYWRVRTAQTVNLEAAICNSYANDTVRCSNRL